jgi:DNA-directed RNA polymerase specialized sigma24 family protein
MDDTCVCCGAYVPEGRQVCHFCEKRTEARIVNDALNKLDEAQRAIVRARAILALVGETR